MCCKLISYPFFTNTRIFLRHCPGKRSFPLLKIRNIKEKYRSANRQLTKKSTPKGCSLRKLCLFRFFSENKNRDDSNQDGRTKDGENCSKRNVPGCKRSDEKRNRKCRRFCRQPPLCRNRSHGSPQDTAPVYRRKARPMRRD